MMNKNWLLAAALTVGGLYFINRTRTAPRRLEWDTLTLPTGSKAKTAFTRLHGFTLIPMGGAGQVMLTVVEISTGQPVVEKLYPTEFAAKSAAETYASMSAAEERLS